MSLYYDEDEDVIRENESNFKLKQLRGRNNPNNEPKGHFTGRCKRCESTDLWDDNAHYGCNSCGAILL